MLVVIIYLFLETPNRLASCSQTDICWGPQADGLGRQARSRLPLSVLGSPRSHPEACAPLGRDPSSATARGTPLSPPASSSREKAQNDPVLAQDPQVVGSVRELMGREELDIIKRLGRMCDPRVILAQVPLSL